MHLGLQLLAGKQACSTGRHRPPLAAASKQLCTPPRANDAKGQQQSLHAARLTTRATDQRGRRLVPSLRTAHTESALRPGSTSWARRRAKRRRPCSCGDRRGILQKYVACRRSTTARCTCPEVLSTHMLCNLLHLRYMQLGSRETAQKLHLSHTGRHVRSPAMTDQLP